MPDVVGIRTKLRVHQRYDRFSEVALQPNQNEALRLGVLGLFVPRELQLAPAARAIDAGNREIDLLRTKVIDAKTVGRTRNSQMAVGRSSGNRQPCLHILGDRESLKQALPIGLYADRGRDTGKGVLD